MLLLGNVVGNIKFINLNVMVICSRKSEKNISTFGVINILYREIDKNLAYQKKNVD